eukprot:GHVN01006251.1.p1 GENE.GHVN01006251.1~~GHVN01006251.1.p1  ORF type:complete len:581 (+),score=56.01 GHVN01006251.1:188-1930(+)
MAPCDGTNPVVLAPMNRDEYIRAKAKTQEEEMDATMISFRSIADVFGLADSRMAELMNEIGWLEKRENELKAILKRGWDSLEALQPGGGGEGVGCLLEVADADSRDSSFILPTVALSKDDTQALNIPSGVRELRVQGAIVPPSSGYYSFKVVDLNGSCELFVNGETVLISQPGVMGGGHSATSSSVWLDHGVGASFLLIAGGESGTPEFELQWSGGVFSRYAAIPQEFLFPSLDDKICSNVFRKGISCETSFQEFTENQWTHATCPPGCVDAGVALNGDSQCYSLRSSVCLAAIHSGVLPERGGPLRLTVDMKQRGHYEGVQGSLVKSQEAAGGTGKSFECCFRYLNKLKSGCGRVERTADTIGGGKVTDVKLVPVDRLKQDGNPFSGYGGVITNSESTIIYTKEDTAKHVTVVKLSCDSASLANDIHYDETIHGAGGSSLSIIKSIDGPIVSDLAITFGEEGQGEFFTVEDGWSRQSCLTVETQVHLYVRYTKDEDAAELPSSPVDCRTTFASLSSTNERGVTVRCPPCWHSTAPVYGGPFVYGEESSVRRFNYQTSVNEPHRCVCRPFMLELFPALEV